MSRKRPSGSPSAQNERRKAYRKQSGPCSNPGQPSSVNRAKRREAKAWRQMDADAAAYERSLNIPEE